MYTELERLVIDMAEMLQLLQKGVHWIADGEKLTDKNVTALPCPTLTEIIKKLQQATFLTSPEKLAAFARGEYNGTDLLNVKEDIVTIDNAQVGIRVAMTLGNVAPRHKAILKNMYNFEGSLTCTIGPPEPPMSNTIH